MSDRECFDFLKSINYDKQYFLDKGWTPKYWFDNYKYKGVMWWPMSFKDELEGDLEDTFIEWFPPGFKLVEEGFNYDNQVFPEKCCTYCKNSKGRYSREYAYGCRLPEVRVANDSSILKGKDHIAPGCSNPVFTWDVKFAPHAVCDYFEAMELNYTI